MFISVSNQLREIRYVLMLILEELKTLSKEMKTMSTNDAALTAAVQKISDDIAANQTELETIIATLQNSPVADDPAVTDAIAKLGSLSTSLEATTAQFATPATPDTPAA